MYIVIPSIGRLNEHHMVPENVCDAEDLVRSTSYGHGTDKTSRKPPTPTPPRTVCNVFLPLHRPCIWSYCRSDGCMSTTWSLKMCVMLKISSGRRHVGTVPMEPPASPLRAPPCCSLQYTPQTVCNAFTDTQAMCIVVSLTVDRAAA